MNDVINVEIEKKKAKTRFICNVVLVIMLSLGVIAASLVLLFCSTLDYIPNLIINIVLDVLFALFLVFYFLTIFPVVSYYHRFYKGLNPLALEHRRRMSFVEEKEMRTLNNVNYRVLIFSYKEGENEYQEHLYVLDSDVSFETNASYTLDTYQNVIVRYKEISDATV